jgi:dCMP deaminase
MTNRPNKIEYYLNIAKSISMRGTCLRRKFGAIIVNNDRIVSTGYVGAPRGRVNCCDRGICFRMEHNIPSGTRYELCRSCHAEMNAVINASPEEMKNATLYLVGIENDGSYTNADCCSMCKRVIINSGIETVIAQQSNGDFKVIPVSQWITNDDSLDINHIGY